MINILHLYLANKSAESEFAYNRYCHQASSIVYILFFFLKFEHPFYSLLRNVTFLWLCLKGPSKNMGAIVSSFLNYQLHKPTNICHLATKIFEGEEYTFKKVWVYPQELICDIYCNKDVCPNENEKVVYKKLAENAENSSKTLSKISEYKGCCKEIQKVSIGGISGGNSWWCFPRCFPFVCCKLRV